MIAKSLVPVEVSRELSIEAPVMAMDPTEMSVIRIVVERILAFKNFQGKVSWLMCS